LGAPLSACGTINLHREYLLAGEEARLVVNYGLIHAFRYDSRLPEVIEAKPIMAKFFVKTLAK
jgi:monoterpene epsilon-lactone hydrolase